MVTGERSLLRLWGKSRSTLFIRYLKHASSSADYCKELAAIISNNSRHRSLGKGPIPLPVVPQSDSGSSAASSTSRGSTPTPSVMASVVSLSALDLHGLPLQGLPPSPSQYSPSEVTLDFDQDYASSPEQYTTSVSRKDHPRDLSSAFSLLSSPLWSTDSSKGFTQESLTTYSRFSSISEAATRLINPRSVSVSSTASRPVSAPSRAKAAVELSATIAGGESTRRTNTDLTDRLMAQAHSGNNSPRSSPVKNTPIGSPTDDGLVIPGSSFQSTISRSDSTAQSSLVDTKLDAQILRSASPSPNLESLESPPWPLSKKDSDGLPFKPSETSPKAGRHIVDQLHVPKKSAEVGGLSPSKRHALLAANESHLPHIDPKPHIKYEWTVGTRLKFSCTVYYAQQFDSLRNRCGVGETFSQSLAATQNWAAEGGKSKSSFWKTQDNRFIIKTLVNSWNVADLCVIDSHDVA
jgi:1-phosphatidylinositol-3-phosphate 5-kinase